MILIVTDWAAWCTRCISAWAVIFVLENGCVYDSSLCARLPLHKSERQKMNSSQLMCLFRDACAKTRITGFLNPLNQAADLISFLRNSMNSAVSCCKSVCPSTVLCPDQHLHKPCMPLTRFQYNSAAGKKYLWDYCLWFQKNRRLSWYTAWTVWWPIFILGNLDACRELCHAGSQVWNTL